MKKFYTAVFLAVFAWGTSSLWAQAPQGFSYQAIARDANGQLVLSQTVGLKVSILSGSATGNVLYAEAHSAATNANGLLSVQVGSGTPLTGSMPSIDWLNGPYFLKSELDLTGGTNYTLVSTAQLVSVPFALHATTAQVAQSALTVSGPLNELDPAFTASPAGGITATNIATWNSKVGTEVDPTFTASPAGGITAANIGSWNSKVGTEVDPTFTASPAGGITATNISTWNNKVGTEVDPTFTASPAGGITAANISTWNNKVGVEIDPTFTASPAGGITSANITSWNNKVGTEVDPTFQASPAKNITSANITSWNNKVAVEVDPTFAASPAAGITSSNITTWNTDLDRSPTNEIQTLTVGNDSLRISLGNKVPLPKGTQWTPWFTSGIRYRNVFVDTARNNFTFTNKVRQEIYLERANRLGYNIGALSRMHNADTARNFYGLTTGGTNSAIFTAQSVDPSIRGRGFQAFVSSQAATNTSTNTGFYGQVNGANEVWGADLITSDGQFVTGIRSAASSLRSGARVIGMESTVESGDSNVAVVAKAAGTTGKRVGLFATTSGLGSSDFAAVFQGKTLVRDDLLYLQNSTTNFNGIAMRSAPGQNNMYLGMVPTNQGSAFAVGDFQGGYFNMPFIIERGARNKFVEVRSWNQLHVGSSPSYSMDLLEVTDTSGAPVGGARAAANFRVYGKRGTNRGLIGVSQGISTGENVGAEFWTSDGATGNVGVRSTIWPNTAGDYFNLAVVGITNNSNGATGRGVAGFAYGGGYGLGAWGEAATQGENWGTTGIALAEAGNNFLQIGVNGVARGSYGTGGTGGGTYVGGYFRAFGLNTNYGSTSIAFSNIAGNSNSWNVGVIAEAKAASGQSASSGPHFGVRAWVGGAGNFNSGVSGYSSPVQNGRYNLGGDFWANSQRADGAAYGLQALAEGTAPEKVGGWLEASGANTNYGVYAKASGGTTNHAGYFEGNVTITGNLNVTGNIAKGGGTFKIDHPLDPANKYLVHSFVESPEMLNVYSGNTVTDAAGRSVVTLPDYFSAANADIRYQLTVVGATFAQAIVGEEIKGNSFVVLTNQPNVKVSWQVTAVRNDAYAKANRIQPEVEKSAAERGGYLHPEVFGSERSVYPTVVKPVNPMDRNAPAPVEGGRE